MSGNPALFPSPPVPYPTLDDEIVDLQTKQQAICTGTHGMAATRDESRVVLCTTLDCMRSYVQSLCDTSPPERAVTLITTAGMKVAASPGRTKPVLEADNLQPPGTVLLRANASLLCAGMGRRSRTFHWEHLLEGGATFVSSGTTPLAHLTVAGLPLLTKVGFRVSVSVSDLPQSAWSQVVTILVQ
jgi:hypothetical protein